MIILAQDRENERKRLDLELLKAEKERKKKAYQRKMGQLQQNDDKMEDDEVDPLGDLGEKNNNELKISK